MKMPVFSREVDMENPKSSVPVKVIAVEFLNKTIRFHVTIGMIQNVDLKLILKKPARMIRKRVSGVIAALRSLSSAYLTPSKQAKYLP